MEWRREMEKKCVVKMKKDFDKHQLLKSIDSYMHLELDGIEQLETVRPEENTFKFSVMYKNTKRAEWKEGRSVCLSFDNVFNISLPIVPRPIITIFIIRFLCFEKQDAAITAAYNYFSFLSLLVSAITINCIPFVNGNVGSTEISI